MMAEFPGYGVMLGAAAVGALGGAWWWILIAAAAMSVVRAGTVQLLADHVRDEWRRYGRWRAFAPGAVALSTFLTHAALCAAAYLLGAGLALLIR
jgi:hypothetical protein